jgi:hypothetical protein
MQLHHEWNENLPKLLSEIIGSTVFTDLAVFVFRDHSFSNVPNTYLDALSSALESRFTPELAGFWKQKIKREQLLAKHIVSPFSPNHEPMLNGRSRIRSDKNCQDAYSLTRRIEYLENLLNENGIPYIK